LPGIGQCYLYNTANTNDPVDPGYYADVSTNQYYYVENDGLVEEIGSCGTTTLATTTQPPPPCNEIDVSNETYGTLAAACSGSPTVNRDRTDGDPNNPQIGDTVYEDSDCDTPKASGIYQHITASAAIEIGSGGAIIDVEFC
jgi:hypothetical protein